MKLISMLALLIGLSACAVDPYTGAVYPAVVPPLVVGGGYYGHPYYGGGWHGGGGGFRRGFYR
jgi:hypothetical protein